MQESGALTPAGRRAWRVGRPSAPPPAEAAALPVARSRCERCAEAIRDDIRKGAYRPGNLLPSMKDLERRYGVTYKTIKKALTLLVRERSLCESASGGLAAPAFSTGIQPSKIICVLSSFDSFTINFGQNDELVFRAVERECEMARIDLEILLLFHETATGNFRFRNKKTLEVYDFADLHGMGNSPVLGFLYFIPWEPGYVEDIAFKAIFSTRRPLAILDESSVLALPHPMAASGRVRVFTVAASAEAGKAVGERLLTLGHRNIAFVSTDHGYRWSQLRLAGLQSVYAEAGLGAGVVAHTVAANPGYSDAGARRCGFDNLYRAYQAWREGIPGPFKNRFDAAFGSLRVDVCGSAERSLATTLLLEEAFRGTTATAWVLANDQLAAAAMAFLKGRNVRIPADMSVVSFDDSSEALRSNFSSYNFNPQAAACSMLGFVLDRMPYSAKPAVNLGFIAERGTSGPARRGAG